MSDWEEVFGFSDDPTPGDAEILDKLARSYRSVADDAGDILPLVSGLEADQVGEGKSMDKLRDKLGDLADQVRKLNSSYDRAAGALDTYADSLRTQQRRADDALRDGRDAKGRLDSATAALLAAEMEVGALDGTTVPPDDEALKQETKRALDQARSEQSTAQGNVDDAQADLDAARLLAEDAREVREADAATAAQALEEAEDEAVPGKSLWERIRDKLSLAFGIIGGILGVLAMFVPGLQGIGLALTIGAFAFSAAAFGINIAKSVETGEWDPLDLILSGIGLVLGAGAIVGSLGKMTSLLKFSNLKDEFFKIPTAVKGIPRNIQVAVNDYKNLPGDFIKIVKDLGSKLDDVAQLAKIAVNPAGMADFLAKTLLALRNFKPTGGALPTVPGLLGVTYRWSRPDVAGFFLGVAGLIYGPAAYAGHTGPLAHDDSRVSGST
ncbi:hypothetical protein [Streptomyces luteolus]|uniref:Putative T7SS secretion signal domain-containing protein n=1 Tax=Streptomyces luteolus TaxID=3043615 RepID=A0ABT6T378_9ACTN|nr:hypothetical protein [Streptomyces sp. B-S-A12]MDI3422323.1 hypothetical protein [Streptomyces sp. B-S-A12]